MSGNEDVFVLSITFIGLKEEEHGSTLNAIISSSVCRDDFPTPLDGAEEGPVLR